VQPPPLRRLTAGELAEAVLQMGELVGDLRERHGRAGRRLLES